MPAESAPPRRPAPEGDPRTVPASASHPSPVPASHPSPAPDPRDGLSWGPRPAGAAPVVPDAHRAPVRAAIDEALVGGRLLAWAGGAALLFGLGTLFWPGVRDGWLTESLRCLIGAVASTGLLAAGLRNARNGSAREASWAMAGTGLAGLYATGAVATSTYGLLPDVVGLAELAALGVASALLALAAGLAVVAGWEIRAARDRERWSMPLLLVVHAAVAAALGGSYALVDEPVAAVVTLAASAALLGGSALLVRRRADAPRPLELVLLSVAVLVLDLGFAIAASGLLQLAGWAVSAVAFAFLARHAARASLPLMIGGLGLHAGLTLVETLGSAGGGGGFLTACAVLAAVCAASGRVVATRSEDARILLDVTAFGVVLWWTAVPLPGEQLAPVLAAEAGALLLLDRRAHDVVARGAAFVFLGIAAAVALLHGDAAAVRASWSVVPDGELGTLVLPLLAVAGAAVAGLVTLRGATFTTVRPVEGSEDVDVAGGNRTSLASHRRPGRRLGRPRRPPARRRRALRAAEAGGAGGRPGRDGPDGRGPGEAAESGSIADTVWPVIDRGPRTPVPPTPATDPSAARGDYPGTGSSTPVRPVQVSQIRRRSAGPSRVHGA